MNHIDVMKQALEALQYFDFSKRMETADNLMKAIIEIEQCEPIAKIKNDNKNLIGWNPNCEIFEDGTLLYTAPPHREWVGLTDFEIRELEMKHFYFSATSSDTTSFAKEIEIKLKEKNT